MQKNAKLFLSHPQVAHSGGHGLQKTPPSFVTIKIRPVPHIVVNVDKSVGGTHLSVSRVNPFAVLHAEQTGTFL